MLTKEARASDDACTSFLFCQFEIRMAGKPPRVIPPAVVSGGFHR